MKQFVSGEVRTNFTFLSDLILVGCLALSIVAISTECSAEERITPYESRQIAIKGFDLAKQDSPSNCMARQTDQNREGGSSIGSPGLEDRQWQLIEVDGAPVASSNGARRPFLKFEPNESRVVGFAGCNNFFGSYTREGPSLKIGPLASTRRVCPDHEMSLETGFLKALEKTREWRIDGSILVLIGDGVTARFSTPLLHEFSADLESMTFQPSSFPPGKVTLSGGEYREPATAGSAEETVVKLTDKKMFGMIDGREMGAAVLYTRTGGTGTFYDLVLVVRKEEGWANTDSVALGDRIKVQDVRFENGRIVVSMTVHGPEDPMCCPTTQVVNRYAVRDDLLVPEAGEETENSASVLIGQAWEWIQTLYNDGKKFAPAQPNKYTVRFRDDGSVEVKADCNLKGGVYSVDESRISIEITHSTVAACEEGSLEDQFIRSLTAGTIWFLKDGDLFIDLKFDSGTMRLSRAVKE